MSSTKCDVVIVGGGHNGLVSAGCLARAGLQVLVVEAGQQLGGCAAGHGFHPGYRTPGLAHLLPAFDRRAARALGINGFGSSGEGHPVRTVALLPDGDSLELAPAAIRAHSSADAAAWDRFHERMLGHAAALRPLFENTPPRFDFAQRGNLLAFGRIGWSIRRRGKRAMRDLLRIISMNFADLAEEEFESDVVRGALALDAVLGTNHGPRSPNTVFTWLHRLVSCGGAPMIHPRGGEGLIEDLAAAARKAGAEIRTGTRVRTIDVSAGQVTAIELDDGSRIETATVISNADPVTTFSELVDADHLDADFRRDVKAIRATGNTGRVTFALDRRPDLPVPDDARAVRWVVAPSIDYIERAFDQVKYGEAVTDPGLEITLPSLANSGYAPEGHHVMSVNVAYAPAALTAESAALADRVTAVLDHHLPGFSDSVVAREALGPREIDAGYGVRGGHWHHGDIALDQFFTLRPVAGFNQYRAPIDGLWLCGAGAHPGGGLTGTSGYNAAQEVLRERKQGRHGA